jgi:hypothetical protein
MQNSSRTCHAKFAQIIINQYHFYIDFKGTLFFDDKSPAIYSNAIRDEKFLKNFYQNLKYNKYGNN